MHPKIDVFYYINLDHRTDRNEKMIHQLRDYQISNVERIPAVNMPKKGYVGCSLSHVKTIEKFLASDHNICVILEDDFQFTQPPTKCRELLDNFFNTDIEWDCVMWSSNTKLSQPYNSFLDKCIRSFTTAGYMINRKFANILLQNMKEGVELLIRQDIQHMYALDVYWMKLQPVTNWFIFNPKLGKQAAGYSDIERKYVNYQC